VKVGLTSALLCCPAAALAQDQASASVEWHWSCRLMEATSPGNHRYGEGGTRTGELLLNFDRTNDQVFVEIESVAFPNFAAERQLRIDGDLRDRFLISGEPEYPAWVVQTASGRRAIERLGSSVIAISSFREMMGPVHPEEFLSYEAVGICAEARTNS